MRGKIDCWGDIGASPSLRAEWETRLCSHEEYDAFNVHHASTPKTVMLTSGLVRVPTRRTWADCGMAACFSRLISALSRLSLSINIEDRIVASAIDNSRLFYFPLTFARCASSRYTRQGITPRVASRWGCWVLKQCHNWPVKETNAYCVVYTCRTSGTLMYSKSPAIIGRDSLVSIEQNCIVGAATMETGRWINGDIVRVNRRARSPTARCISPASDSAWVIGNYRHCHRTLDSTTRRKLFGSTRTYTCARVIIYTSMLVSTIHYRTTYRFHAPAASIVRCTSC